MPFLLPGLSPPASDCRLGVPEYDRCRILLRPFDDYLNDVIVLGGKKMGRIEIDLFATLDLVAQAPGGPEEDTEGGFKFGVGRRRTPTMSWESRSSPASL